MSKDNFEDDPSAPLLSGSTPTGNVDGMSTQSSFQPPPPAEDKESSVYKAEVVYEHLPPAPQFTAREEDTAQLFTRPYPTEPAMKTTTTTSITAYGSFNGRSGVAMHDVVSNNPNPPPVPQQLSAAPALPDTMVGLEKGRTTHVRPRPVKQGPHYWPTWKTSVICFCNCLLLPIFSLFCLVGLAILIAGIVINSTGGVTVGDVRFWVPESVCMISIAVGSTLLCFCLWACGAAACVKRTRIPFGCWVMLFFLALLAQGALFTFLAVQWREGGGEFLYKDVISVNEHSRDAFNRQFRCCGWWAPDDSCDAQFVHTKRHGCAEQVLGWGEQPEVLYIVGAVLGAQVLLFLCSCCMCCTAKKDKRRYVLLREESDELL